MKGKIFALRKVFGTLLVSITFALTCGAALPLRAFAQEQDAKAPSSSHNAVVLLLDDSASMTPQSREGLKEAAKRIGKGILESDVKARVAIALCGRSNAVLPFTGEFDSVKSFVDARVSGTGNTGVDAGAGLQSADATARRLGGGPSDAYVKSIVAISDGASVSGDSAQRQVRSLTSTYRIYSLGLSGSAASAVESLKQIQNAGYFEERDLDALRKKVTEYVATSSDSVKSPASRQNGQSGLDTLTGGRLDIIAVLGSAGTSSGDVSENGKGANDQGKGSGGVADDNASKAPSAPEEGSNSADASTPGAPTDDGSTSAAPVPDGNAPSGNNAPSAPTGPRESTSGAGNAAPKGTLSQTNSSGNGAAGSNDAEGENVRNRFVNSADNRDDDDGRDPDPDPTPISDSVPDGKKATGSNSGKSHLPQTSDPSSTLATLPFSLGVLSIASGLFLRRRDDHEDAING